MQIVRDGLRIVTAKKDELEELDAIYSEACGHYKFDCARPILPPTVCLTKGDIPNGGKRENYEMLSIYLSGVLVGYTSVYRDFPGKRAVQLMFFYISDACAESGCRRAAAEMMIDYFRDAGYGCMRILLSLRNWRELEFWFDCGFDRVTDIRTSGDLTDGATGIIGLEHRYKAV